MRTYTLRELGKSLTLAAVLGAAAGGCGQEDLARKLEPWQGEAKALCQGYDAFSYATDDHFSQAVAQGTATLRLEGCDLGKVWWTCSFSANAPSYRNGGFSCNGVLYTADGQRALDP